MSSDTDHMEWMNSYEVGCLKYAAAERMGSPSFMLKPRLSIDGNQWCALYGANLQDGVAGFGDSPDKAYYDFDKNWTQALTAVKDSETKG